MQLDSSGGKKQLRFLLAILTISSIALGDACLFSTGAPVIRKVSANPVADKVYNIFTNNCIACHGKGKSGGAGVIDDILDAPGLLKNGFVNPVDPPNSRIFLAVNRTVRTMPLGGTPLSLPDKTAILDWIKAGAPPFSAVPPPVVGPGTYVSYDQIVACIDQDVLAIDYKKKGDAVNYRYFQLDNVYNTGDTAAFTNLGYALDKALNQLAFGPTKITNSTKIDPAGVIRRIDLRDFNRRAAEFDVLLLGLYPYAIDYSKGNYYSRQEIDDIVFFEGDIARLTRSPRAFIRADFFVDEGLGDLYYQLLFPIKGQADNLQQLENTLGVNANAAIADFEVNASAIRRSGVSIFNRMIHRYDSVFNLRGVKTTTSYWKTFDVLNEVAKRNFFAFPLGPEGVDFGFATAREFQFDAGEEIFGLPNGLQGFFIADAKGVRLQEAAINVAVDRDNVNPFIGSAPGVVKAGISCNHCHGGGVNTFVDQALFNTSKASGLTAQEANAIRQLFPVQPVWNTAFSVYNTTFLTSHKVIAADTIFTTLSGEPTWNTDRVYQDYQSRDQVAAELNVSRAELDDCLFHDPNLANESGLADPILGRITRQDLIDLFGRFADECGLGKLILFKKVKPPSIKPPPVKPPTPPKCFSASVKNNRKMTEKIQLAWSNEDRFYTTLAPGETYTTKKVEPFPFLFLFNGTNYVFSDIRMLECGANFIN